MAVKPVAISNMLAESPVCRAVSWQRISQSSSAIERTRFTGNRLASTLISLALQPISVDSRWQVCAVKASLCSVESLICR